jgi:hypothetical protein
MRHGVKSLSVNEIIIAVKLFLDSFPFGRSNFSSLRKDKIKRSKNISQGPGVLDLLKAETFTVFLKFRNMFFSVSS